jgi:hypothetical protein
MAVDLRGLTGPPAAKVGAIAHPPVVTLDIGSNGLIGNYVHSVVRIPDGFRDASYAGGLAVAFKYGGESTDWNGDPTATTGSAYIGLHRRAASTRMGRGWAVVDGSYIPSTGWMHLAAQRRGEYIYGVTTGTASATEDINTAFAVRCPTVDYSETRHWQVSPVFENDGEQSMTSGAVHSIWGETPSTSTCTSPTTTCLASGSCKGIRSCTPSTTGSPWSYQFKTEPVCADERSEHVTFRTTRTTTGCRRTSRLTTTVHISCRLRWCSHGVPVTTGTPEMWWFGMENYQGAFTGRLTIYRSTWAAGNFQPAAGLEGSTNNTINRLAYNPDGGAFSHFWFDPANIVGTVGPFNIDMNHGFTPAVTCLGLSAAPRTRTFFSWL